MAVDLKKVRKIAKQNRESHDLKPLRIIDGGDDVEFNLNVNNGLWKGSKPSEMAADHEGRNLLRWILRHDFDEEAKEIIETQLESVY